MIGHGLFIYQNMKKTMMSYTRLLIFVQSKEIFVEIAEKLGIQPIESRPEITLDGLDKLGIEVTKLDEITEDIIIGFVISST